MADYAVDIEALAGVLKKTLASSAVESFHQEHGELTIEVNASHYLEVCRVLRDAQGLQFEILVDLCGVDYSEYRQEKITTSAPGLGTQTRAKQPKQVGSRSKQETLSRNRRQQLEKKLAALEARIHALESEKALLETKLANPPSDGRKAAAEIISDS